ncbi:hypothetical protein GBAR_LOCUS12765, partial [Geodia barretti]
DWPRSCSVVTSTVGSSGGGGPLCRCGSSGGGGPLCCCSSGGGGEGPLCCSGLCCSSGGGGEEPFFVCSDTLAWPSCPPSLVSMETTLELSTTSRCSSAAATPLTRPRPPP